MFKNVAENGLYRWPKWWFPCTILHNRLSTFVALGSELFSSLSLLWLSFEFFYTIRNYNCMNIFIDRKSLYSMILILRFSFMLSLDFNLQSSKFVKATIFHCFASRRIAVPSNHQQNRKYNRIASYKPRTQLKTFLYSHKNNEVNAKYRFIH